MNKKQKENICFRSAMCDIIAHSILKRNVKRLYFDRRTYAYEKDMVHFTWGGERCVLYAIEKPDFEKGVIPMLVKAKNRRKNPELWGVEIPIDELQCKTLERIAYETYDWCKEAEDEDFDDVKKEKVADWLDTNYENL
jgi:hypothetical protein